MIEPSALVLTELADGSAYHFDMRRPLELPEIVEEARAQELQHTEVRQSSMLALGRGTLITTSPRSS